MAELLTYILQILFLVFFLACSTFVWLTIFYLTLRLSSTIKHTSKTKIYEDKVTFGLPRVTAIVPARNEQNYIKRCVKSLLAQSYPHLQILVINDNSSDNTIEILNSIKNDRLRIISINEPPQGWARKAWASQVGFLNSSADVLLFTDADTNYFNKNAILNSVISMEKNFHKVMTGIPLLELNDFCSKMVMPLLNFFSDLLQNVLLKGLYKYEKSEIVGSFFLVRRHVLISLDGFNKVKSSFQEDADIGWEIRKLNVQIKTIKLNNMVSAMWSRDYQTLRQGIKRLVAYNITRNRNEVMLLCFLMFSLVFLPYILLIYDVIYCYIGSVSGQIDKSFLVWDISLCMIPIVGYLIANRVKHKVQLIYSMLVFPASCFLLYNLITNAVRLILRRSDKWIIWKEVKYVITD